MLAVLVVLAHALVVPQPRVGARLQPARLHPPAQATPLAEAAFAPGALAALCLLSAAPAEAADALPTAVVAYGHYLGVVGAGVCLGAQRAIIRQDMSKEDTELLALATNAYSLALVTTVASGYARVVEYGKGWEFYSHEPIFWVKMALTGVLLGASAFPAVTVLKSASSGKPLSPALVKRMTSVINAELLAIVSIPFAATLMARGVLYAQWFPWPAGLAPAALAFAGLSFKYSKEALTWTDPQSMPNE